MEEEKYSARAIVYKGNKRMKRRQKGKEKLWQWLTRNYLVIFILLMALAIVSVLTGLLIRPSIKKKKVLEHKKSTVVNKKVDVSCLAFKSVWIKVFIDGVLEYTGLLKEGFHKKWEGEHMIELHCNDFSQLNVIIEHQSLKSFGKRYKEVKSICILENEVNINTDTNMEISII